MMDTTLPDTELAMLHAKNAALRAGHTPFRHPEHTLPCGCAISEDEVFIVCTCGAWYTAEVMNFPFFTCYDCGRITTEKLRSEADLRADNEALRTDLANARAEIARLSHLLKPTAAPVSGVYEAVECDGAPNAT